MGRLKLESLGDISRISKTRTFQPYVTIKDSHHRGVEQKKAPCPLLYKSRHSPEAQRRVMAIYYQDLILNR